MEKDFGACTIYVTSSAPSEINITVPFLNQTITKQTIPGVSTKIDLSTTIRMRGFGLENKGVFVNANTTVSVYATNAKGNSRDAFVIFPIAILRTEYVVATYAPRTKSLVGIIALQDDTLVQIKLHLRENITYKGNVYKNGDILRIFLNKLQTFQLQSSEDLTGTFVVSTRPVAVLGGNICANVPTGVTGCSHICTQLVPVSKWGTRFMTSPIVKRKRNDYFRIISAFDNTTIKIYGKKSRTLNASGHYEFSLGNEEARYIKCSKPAMLMQYNKGSANYIQSEPFALTVPPVEQYTSVYNLPIPVENKKPPFLNCISFIAKTGERIVFDNKKFCRKVNLTSIPIEQSNYTVYSCSLRKVNLSTVIPIRHALEGGTLAVYMVGHTDKDGYGYLGGMGMRDVNCIRLFQNGLTTSNSCDDGIEKDMVNITGCDWKSSKNKIPRIKSEYLHGSEVSHRVSQTGDCKDVITRTYKLKIPNGSYAILAQQEIQWNKQKPTIQLPQQTLVTEFNSTSLEKIVRKMSLLCPGDILYFNDSSSDWVNGTKVIQRLWTVQETCGRVTTAKQTIIGKIKQLSNILALMIVKEHMILTVSSLTGNTGEGCRG